MPSNRHVADDGVTEVPDQAAEPETAEEPGTEPLPDPDAEPAPNHLVEAVEAGRPGGDRDEHGFRTHRTPGGFYPDAPENATEE